MNKLNNEARERKIYEQYQNIIAPFIVELEVRDTEYPIEIFNEIRAIFTHLSRYKLQNSISDLNAAESHVKRAILDCFKYICISIKEKLIRFRHEYRNVDLKLADNGNFLPKLNQLENIAEKSYIKAKREEIKRVSTENLYLLYEQAYNCYSELDKFLDDSSEAILFASSHSKNSNKLTVISCFIGVVGIVSTIITIVMAL